MTVSTAAERPQDIEKQKIRDCFPDVVPCETIVETGATVPVFLENLPPEIFVKEGDDVSLFSIIKGVPTPFVIWLYNQLIVEESALTYLRHDGPLCSLTLLNVNENQRGIYKCRIVNSAGQAECSTRLRVKGWQLHVPSIYNVLLHSIIALKSI